ncbi:tRNA pseudouridine synthase B [Rickettsiales endosymbiont of Paramecium tredecaurelia]|uniref:tRNA pseudouridine(55) synthase TruB n=1 Tax=Candidatus Sarmatiella mevalonica TaxID=2770581 RepID=UPI0019228763|nr:tRNA pseudouridine(55) synthase TruB [Candidatus Sarmatiella mevalonica]MBL3284245.1 tRNA pseudouridine synthase B [Candidatus Sarmatiella mevalonica]
MEGWINLYKPKGISSSKATLILKPLVWPNKIGHCGTLDLEAHGVLPVAIGNATKFVDLVSNQRKKYFFTVQFGACTDTGDSAGKYVETTNIIPSNEDMCKVCDRFLGTITQTPSKFSAIKINGQRAYKLARSEQEFEMPSRQVHIYCLKLVACGEGWASYEVECSKGTYVRSLAEQMASCLQSLGFVIDLERLSVGKFCANSALSLDLFKCPHPSALVNLKSNLLNLEFALDDILVLSIAESDAQKIAYGSSIDAPCSDDNSVCVKYNGKIVAIGLVKDKRFIPKKVFNNNLNLKEDSLDVDYTRKES